MSDESRELFNFVISSTTTEQARNHIIDAGLDNVSGGLELRDLVQRAARQYAKDYGGGEDDASVNAIFSKDDLADVEFELTQWVMEQIDQSQKMVSLIRPPFR